MNSRRRTRPALVAALALALTACEWPSAERAIAPTATATADPSAMPTVPSSVLAAPDTVGALVDPGSPGVDGPEDNPIPIGTELAPTGFLRPGGVVDGIRCAPEKFLFHVHTRLTVFVAGKPRQIPAAVGIAPPLGIDRKPKGQFFVNNGDCFAWLHTHTPDGIIHIESPIQRQFTLGNFFDVWGQPLGPEQVGPEHGQVTAFFNGKRYLGNPRDIPLGRHVEIQLDVGDPIVMPEHIAFGGGL